MVQGNGSADEVDGLLVPAGMMRGQAEEMPGVGVVGIGLDDLAIDISGLAKFAGLVMLDGDCQELIWSRHGAFSSGNLTGETFVQARMPTTPR
jgi:hypothetical protein